MPDRNTVMRIDHARGVIYVDDATTGETLLRVCRLPVPIPMNVGMIDVTNGVGSSYTPQEPFSFVTPGKVYFTVRDLPADLPAGVYPVRSVSTELVDGPDGRVDLEITTQYLDSPEGT